MGKLNSSNSEEIKKKYQASVFGFSGMTLNKKEEEKEETYTDIYNKKYIKEGEFNRVYFDSIFQYILGNDFFDFAKLKKEINDLYRVENNEIPEKEKLIHKLNYWQCLDIQDSEYRTLTAKLISFVDSGDFILEQYPSIFNYVVRFENLLGYNIPNLLKRFKKGIKKGKSKYKYSPSLQLKIHAPIPIME